MNESLVEKLDESNVENQSTLFLFVEEYCSEHGLNFEGGDFDKFISRIGNTHLRDFLSEFQTKLFFYSISKVEDAPSDDVLILPEKDSESAIVITAEVDSSHKPISADFTNFEALLSTLDLRQCVFKR